MIVVNNLSKYYGKTCAVKQLNLEIPDGGVCILLGPNGAGKSTVIKSITGLLRYSGEVTIDGYHNKSVEAKRELAYVAEFPAMYELLTIWEHMEFVSRAYRLDHWKERAERLLDLFELTDKKDKLGSELSKGMQQKLSICCGMLPNPRNCLFDEPLVGLDPHAIKELKNIILQRKEEGAAILISTHMLDSVKEFWDSAYIMMNGSIAAHATREQVEAAGDDLEDIFFSITEGKDSP